MPRLAPSTFSFSSRVTAVTVSLACIMVICSFWQWERYRWKQAIVETYRLDSLHTPPEFPYQSPEGLDSVIDRRVHLRGTYDYAHEVIVTNKRHPFGPGHILLTPLKLEGTDVWVMVSRGFIPFADLRRESWEKYRFEPEDDFTAIVKRTIRPLLFAPKNPEPSLEEPQAKWYYEEIEKIARQLPYPVLSSVYLQRVGPPPRGQFPAEKISIEVPPSTHYGYTIEWAVLAFVTLVIGYVLQAFPWYRGTSENPDFGPHNASLH